MSEKFKNEFRIDSVRWQSWDYGKNAAYHGIICRKNRPIKANTFNNSQNLPLNNLCGCSCYHQKFFLDVVD